ncbi:CCDC88A, partial [Cervus elaphus hippelaphus]
VKKNYEALKQRQDEERMVQSSPPAAGEDNRWERESQETTRELLKVKDRLIEVERNNATLQAEKQALKTQLRQLETQNSNLQAQILALQRQTVALQEQNSTLQTQNAKLQVENSTLNSQSTSLMNQNAQLLIQQSSLENENESVIKEREDLKSLYDSLVKDHEKLELLHERQASEYETLIAKHGTLKSAHKNLEVEHKDLEDRYNQLLKQKGQLEDLEKTLKVEQEKMLLKNKNHETVAAEFKKLCGENDRLNHTYNQLLKETEVLQTDHKNLKSLLNNSKLEQTRLEAEFSKLKEQYQQLDITSTKLNNQCELLSQLKGNLEEENRHLLDQIQTLMLQNRTLLEQNMESKDLFHVEQRQYMRGNWITLKMRKLIKSKKDVNRERQKSLTLTPTRSDSSEGFLQLPHQDSQDSSSVGSNSLEDGQTLGTKKSSTMNDLVQSMVLAGGQWTGSTENLEVPDDISTGKRRKELGAMAFSTTAINFSTVNSSTGFRSKQLVNNKASRPASLDSGRTSTSNSNNNASLHEVKGAVNIQSRPQSHSSGEFSLLHEHEAWSSSGSSPIQYLKRQTRSSPVLQHRTLESRAHHKIKTGSPGSEVVTLQQFLEESNKLTSLKPSSQENLLDEVMKSLSVSSDFLGKNKPVSCGLARSVSGKTPGDFHDRRTTKPEQFVRPGPQKAEDTCFMSSSGKPTRGAQGKIKLIKETSLSRQSKDSNPYATLPRASSVISTAEGTTRRTSIHDFLAKDSRLPVSVDSPPASADSGVTATSSEYCLHQRSSHTPHSPTSALGSQAQNALATDRPQSPHTQARNSRTERSHFLNQTFAMINMSNDAFGRSATDSLESFTVAHLAQPFLSLNTELVSNISGLPPRPVTRVTDQASASLEKTAQKDNEQFSGHQSHSSINPQSSVDNNTLTTPACLYPDDTEAALLVSEDNQTVW